MAYAVLADFKERLGANVSPPGLYDQLTDRLTLTTANDTVGQTVLTEAHAILNQKLSCRYVIPIATGVNTELDAWLNMAVLTIAAWRAWHDHPMKNRLRISIQKEYDELMQALKDLCALTAALPGDPEETGGVTAVAFGYPRRYKEDWVT